MTVKTNFSKEKLSEIISKYDLGELKESKTFSSGTVQTNIFFETTKGKFVFRLYENRSKESVLFESHLIQYLNKHNYPCPNVFKNKNEEFVGVFNKKPYVIFEFVEGEYIENPTEDQKRQLIQKVAELQNLTKDYEPFNKEYRWNYNIELCSKLAKQEAKKIKTDNSKRKCKWVENELLKLNLPKSLLKGICHCDFHFSNVLFKNDKFNALIDFDDANYTFLVFDLVCLINPFTPEFDWNTWKKYKKNDNVFDFGETRKVISEYSKYRPLDNNEKKYLFDVFKLSILFDCIWFFERGDVEDFFEKRKIDYLNSLGRENFYNEIFDYD